MNVHEQLVEARNYLERVGWCKNPGDDYGIAGRAQCALGAVHATVGHVDAQSPVTRELYRIRQDEDGLHAGVTHWNDAPERTKAEVLALFDKAIAATAPEPMDPLHGIETKVPVAA